MFLPGLVCVDLSWREDFCVFRNQSVTMLLESVSIQAVQLPSKRADAAAQTAWLRRGMPREAIPKETFLNLILHIKSLQEGCQHKHAMSTADLRKLEGLKVLELREPRTIHFRQGDHKMIVWVFENTTAVGTLTQTKSEHCSFLDIYCVCVKFIAQRNHEVALYEWKSSIGNSDKYMKMFNFFTSRNATKGGHNGLCRTS